MTRDEDGVYRTTDLVNSRESEPQALTSDDDSDDDEEEVESLVVPASGTLS
jgi:hypothetical protein